MWVWLSVSIVRKSALPSLKQLCLGKTQRTSPYKHTVSLTLVITTEVCATLICIGLVVITKVKLTVCLYGLVRWVFPRHSCFSDGKADFRTIETLSHTHINTANRFDHPPLWLPYYSECPP